MSLFFFPLLLSFSSLCPPSELSSARLTDWDCGSRGVEEYVPSLSGLAVNLCGYWCGIPSASSDGREGGRNVCGRHVCSLGSAAVSGGSADINRWIVWQSCALVGRLAERPGCGRVCVWQCIYMCVCTEFVSGSPPPPAAAVLLVLEEAKTWMWWEAHFRGNKRDPVFGGRERGREKKRGTCSPEFTPGEPHPPWGPRTPVTAEFQYQCANRAGSAGADGQVAKMTASLMYPLRTDQIETRSSSSSSVLHTWPLCTVHVLLTLQDCAEIEKGSSANLTVFVQSGKWFVSVLN